MVGGQIQGKFVLRTEPAEQADQGDEQQHEQRGLQFQLQTGLGVNLHVRSML